MKRLTFCTQAYEQPLREFAAAASEAGRLKTRRAGHRNGLFYLPCTFDALNEPMLDDLAVFLEHIAMRENPVYRHSEKLRELARELRRTPVHDDQVRSLAQYLRASRSLLHVEGYVKFRMGAYRDKLDMMSYMLVKKLGLTIR